MRDPTALAREALREAARLRRHLGVGRCDPLCIYDVLEERLGIEVKFQAIPSMEGMYIKSPSPVILIGSERPPGRQAYTCAHELGHHVFGHGGKVDKCLGGEETPKLHDPQEWLADRFASDFLMPKHAVEKAFRVRGWYPESCQLLQVYTVAGQLGVGYETLVQQMWRSLRMLSASQATTCLRILPKQLRSSILGELASSHLLIVDLFWDSKVAADLQVGDHAILPRGTSIEQRVVRTVGDHEMGVLVEAKTPGTEHAVLNDGAWAVNVRVSRKSYVGRSLFRHLEDPDYE
jgi:hypothetical protein